MKILITGGNGFIGKFLVKNLQKNHKVFAPTSKDLPLTRGDLIDKYVKKHTKDGIFDLVIHTAMEGVNFYDPVNLNRNLAIFFNLMQYKGYWKNFINIGSGAEFDKTKPIFSEINDLNSSFPLELYGMTKNVIARIISTTPNCYNLRLFGCFGWNEISTRFITQNLEYYVNSEPLKINQDKYFDFFNIKDTLKVIEYYIEGFEKNYPLEKDIDLVYPDKLKLSDIAQIINNLSDKNVEIETDIPELGDSYTGSKLGVPYNIEFDGIAKGIKQMYNTRTK